MATHTLHMTDGGILSRPVAVNGQLENREHLCLTLSFNHNIIAGALAARFIQRLKALIEAGAGLPEET